MTEKTFLLVLASPGVPETIVRCDAVSFVVPDGVKGKNGGSIGIHPGHTKAMMALDHGELTAKMEGQEILSCTTSGGFAMVESQRVTILSDGLQIVRMDNSFCVADVQ